MASLAVTFGSFGDIAVVVQLVNQLYNALNGVAGVPTAIQLLARRLQLYKDILADVEEVLCRPESSLKPRTRAGIEDQLKGCHETLLALTARVTAFTVQLQQLRPRRPRRPIQLFMLAVLWQHIHARKVAALCVQLDEYFSVLDRYLTISQCNNQDALLAAAKDNRVSTTRILSIIDSDPRHVVVGPSVMQLYDSESNTYYEAFAVVPVRMLAAYLQPIISFIDTCKFISSQLDYIFESPGLSPGLCAETVASMFNRPLTPETRISMGLTSGGNILSEITTILQCIVFSPASGEPHALLGVPPSNKKDLSTRIFSDILRGEFHGNVDVGLYEEESLDARYVQNTMMTYNRLIACAGSAISLLYRSGEGCPTMASLCKLLETFPDPEFLNRSTEIKYVETALDRPGDLNLDDLWKFFEVLGSAPRIPGIPEATRDAGFRCHFGIPHLPLLILANPVTMILAQMAVANREGAHSLAPGRRGVNCALFPPRASARPRAQAHLDRRTSPAP